MNRIYWYFRGYIRVTISGASIDWAINRLTASRIPFWGLERSDDFTLHLCVFVKDVEKVRNAVSAAMCEIIMQKGQGLREIIGGVFHRPIFLMGIAISMLTVLFCQNFLLFFDVAGNETITDTQIIREVENLGIRFGTYGPNVKPKWIKDHILNVMPQLQWITVTQNGCMAQIIVRERPERPEVSDRKGYANIVAQRDGQITDISVLSGQPVVQSGDLVLEGELLVSGVIDLERIFSVVHAQAEIYARTWREKTIVTPEECWHQEQMDGSKTCIWLELGKNRIKLFGNSGISDTACDKMINRRFITLSGDLQLPVSVLVETMTPCVISELSVDTSSAQAALETYAVETVQSELVAGEITSRLLRTTKDKGCHVLHAKFECREMIARTVEGKWNKEDFHNG